MSKTRVSIAGGSGYVAAELIRLLLHHPDVVLEAVASRSGTGKPIASVHRNLIGATEMTFCDLDPATLAAGSDLLFFALPHGESAGRLPELIRSHPALKIIDLATDFRLDPTFVYGLTEFNRDAVSATRLLANPGCFATGTLLALAPLAEAGLLANAQVVVNGVTGSSGSGALPKAGTHHPERSNDFRAYKPLTHQHIPEMAQEIATHGAPPKTFAFVPHSAPLARGIHTTATVLLESENQATAAKNCIEARYASELFIHVVDDPPRLVDVKGTNNVHCFAVTDGSTLAVMTALDNLVKGAAGQAVQNMNRMIGSDETAGLLQPGGRP